MLSLRVLSALVGIPLIVFAVLTGGWPLFAGTFLIALAAQAEFYALLTRKGYSGSNFLGFLAATLVLWAVYTGRMGVIPHVLIGLVVALFTQEMALSNVAAGLNNIAGTTMGVLYPVLPLTYLFLLRNLSAFHLLFVFVITWANDSGAYFIGRAVGRRPLSPTISQNKTVEGAVGGL
ncbi:MAG: phosphatidate cytidylyltransferase, partial [Firmicutes bacterium]|nr:phosphatidate cytidylyltransferase [Bacillota bacterium]